MRKNLIFTIFISKFSILRINYNSMYEEFTQRKYPLPDLSLLQGLAEGDEDLKQMINYEDTSL